MIRGAVVVLVMLLVAWAAGAVFQATARAVPGGWLIEAAAVLCLIFQRRLVDGVRAVMGALGAGDLSASRFALGGLCGRDTAAMDEVAVAEATVESTATRVNDGVVGGAFWYLFLGLPGLCVFRSSNVIAGRIGHPTERHAAFGLTAARLDDMFALLPAAISGGVLVLASMFVPAVSPSRAMAGALGLAAVEAARGAGSGPVTTCDVARAMLMVIIACLIAATAIAGLALLTGAP